MEVGERDWDNGSHFMVVGRGETLSDAIDRHRRDTGHDGALIVAVARGARAGRKRGRGARLAAVA